MTVHLVTGDDETLLATGVIELVHALVGDGDRGLMVDEFDDPDYTLRDVVDAALTPALFTPRRVVVARGIGRFAADDLAPLLGYLVDPSPDTDLVLGAGGGRLAKSLTDALKHAGANVIDTAPPSKPQGRQGWISEQFDAAGLHLDAGAMAAVVGWMGEDAGRLPSVIETLVSAYGTAGRLAREQVVPFLGEAGDVPPWDLTDAIDRGETTVALSLLHRMIDGGGRHPLAVMSILHGHYTKLLKLDGADARDEASAAAAMGIKAGFPARKALDQYRRLGGDGVVRAIGLLAQADLDLRGAKDWPEALVMEVLVARLSKLTGVSRRR